METSRPALNMPTTYGETVTVHLCLRCSALILNPEHHEEWHQSLNLFAL